jgi:hypothetical protein
VAKLHHYFLLSVEASSSESWGRHEAESPASNANQVRGCVRARRLKVLYAQEEGVPAGMGRAPTDNFTLIATTSTHWVCPDLAPSLLAGVASTNVLRWIIFLNKRVLTVAMTEGEYRAPAAAISFLTLSCPLEVAMRRSV